MKLVLLSGAYTNAGDFLIVDRAIRLITTYLRPEEIIVYRRNEPLSNEQLKTINQSDGLVLAGGPMVEAGLFPEKIPFVSDLASIKVPFFSIGLGWNSLCGTSPYVFDWARLDMNGQRFFERIAEEYPISCRDWYTVHNLRAQGFANVIMTGCPAWYDLDYVNSVVLRSRKIKKISISNPAHPENYAGCVEIAALLRRKYSNAEIQYVKHAATSDNPPEAIESRLLQLGITVVSIGGTEKSFSVYNDCDFHIGYRVHAHIYNLSHRNASLLIEEDGRGAGANDALGTPSLTAYDPAGISTKMGRFVFRSKRFIGDRLMHQQRCFVSRNSYLLREVEETLYRLEQTDWRVFERTFCIQKQTLQIMADHICHLKE